MASIKVCSAALVLCLTRAVAQEGLLLPYGSAWKFNDSGADLGTNWIAPDYDDSSWKIGVAPFGWPPDETMPPQVPAIRTFLTLSNNMRTFYFRTQFVFQGNASNVVLVASNVLDDGAVVYLNGAEVHRIAMPSDTITNQTLATRATDVSSTGIDVIAIGSHLVHGTNHLAVEVHQGSVVNSDVVFAMALSFKAGSAPAIIAHPRDFVVECAGPPASLSLVAAGTDLRFQWFSNTTALAGQTNAWLDIPATRTNMNNAAFGVLVSNVLGSVRSSNAIATIYPDTCGPRVLVARSRDYLSRSNEVEVVFDESLTGRSVSHYAVEIVGDTNRVAVTNLVGGANRVIFSIDTNLHRSRAYILFTTGVTDLRSNAIAPNTRTPISFVVSNRLFDLSQPWSFRDGILDCSPPAPNWNTPSYSEDDSWGGPEPGPIWSFPAASFFRLCDSFSYQPVLPFSEVSPGCIRCICAPGSSCLGVCLPAARSSSLTISMMELYST